MSDKKKTKSYRVEIIGTIVAILIIIIWYNFFTFNDGKEWEVRGQLGDSFGVLNTLFSGLALAGIILTILLQRNELGLQREELRLTREEFTTNRLTNILYQQINIQQNVINDFSISLSTISMRTGVQTSYIKGNSGFLYLYKELGSFTILMDDERSPEQIMEDMIAHYQKNLTEYVRHEESLLDFSTRTSNSIRAIKNILANSELSTHEMKQFVELFFSNMGYHIESVIEDVSETFEEYIKLPEGVNNEPIDFGRMGLVNINLKNIINFKNFDFNRDRAEIINDLKK